MGSIQDEAFNDHRLAHDAVAYIGTLTCHKDEACQQRSCRDLQAEYSHDISL